MKFISYREKRNKLGRLIRKYRIYNFFLFRIKKKVLPVLGENNKIIIGGRELNEDEKKLLDKFGKITIEGNNNIVELSNSKDLMCDIHIEGNGNFVELPNVDDAKCDICIEGNGNVTHIGMRDRSVNDKKIIGSKVRVNIDGNSNIVNLIDIFNVRYDSDISGDNNKVYVGKVIRAATLRVIMPYKYNYRELSIEDAVSFGDCQFILLGNNRKIHIGKNCMLSIRIWIKTTDQHPIYDLETNERVNAEQDVIIGDNVWIGQDVYVSKGSVIPSGCIVGAKSFVNKVFTQENCVIAGIPAKVVKENVRWEESFPTENL